MFQNPFSFRGRITRTEIGLSYFFSFFAFLFLFLFTAGNFYDFPSLFFTPPFIALFWFLICQGVKRCHDVGQSGVFLIIPFYFLAIVFIEGQKENNQYGDNPKLINPGKKNFFDVNFRFDKHSFKSWVQLISELLALLFFTLFFISLLIYFFEHNQQILFYGSGLLVFVCFYLFLQFTQEREHIANYRSYHFYQRFIYAVLLVVLIHLFFYYFREMVFYDFHFLSNVLLIFNVFFLTYFSTLLFKKRSANKIRFQKVTHVATTVVVFFVFTVLIGFNTKGTYADGFISWSEKNLEWNNFNTTFLLFGGYDASIYSSIHIPRSLDQDEFQVYAYMIPSKSFKLAFNDHSDNQLLKHEQYHFNITEYMARLMRKELISFGKQNLTENKIRKIQSNYLTKTQSLQSRYDYETNHNLDYEKQRYWELKIDDFLRQTAYYVETDLMKYQAFNPQETNFYKKVTQSFNGEVLTSYPISEFESNYGNVYEVIKTENKTTITYFENGLTKNGGFFENAITTFIKNDDSIEIIYTSDEGEHDDSLTHTREVITFEENGDLTVHFFDQDDTRISNEGIFELRYAFLSENEYLSSYFNDKGEKVKNSRLSFYEKRTIDDNKRLVKIESFDRNLQPIINIQNVYAVEFVYDSNNNIIQQKRFNKSGDYAFGSDAFYETFVYDERGNLMTVEKRNAEGNLRNDNQERSYIVYNYNFKDKLISKRRYTQDESPAWGIEEYYQIVTDYDSLGREVFSATYYPGYVLKFDENNWGATRYQYENDTTRLLTNVDAYGTVITDVDSVSHILEMMNSKQQLIEKRLFNNKKQFSIKEGIPVVNKYKYDERGNMTESVSFDSLLNLFPFEEDVARVRWDYDKNNNKIRTAYYKTTGELADAYQYAAFNFYFYDENNNLIKRTNYDKHMQPVEVDGVYKYEITPNQRGNDSIVKLYGADKKLKDGASILKYYYDDFENLIVKTFFDKNNKPILNEYGVHKVKLNYNKYSRFISESYFDVNLKPNVDAFGYHSYKIEYDNRNFIKSERYLDTNGNGVDALYGFYMRDFYKDNQGLSLRVTYFDSNNRKVGIEDGVADYLFQRYPSGFVSRYSLYNEDGYLINDSDGIAEYFYYPSLNGLYYLSKAVDSEGNIIEENEEF